MSGEKGYDGGGFDDEGEIQKGGGVDRDFWPKKKWSVSELKKIAPPFPCSRSLSKPRPGHEPQTSAL